MNLSQLEVSRSWLRFPLLEKFPWLIHGFTIRQPGLDVKTSRTEALERLAKNHQEILKNAQIRWQEMRFGEQVHGNQIAIIQNGQPTLAAPVFVSGKDGVVTQNSGTPIGVYVADCCAIYLVEREKKAIGLLHSGKKGTEGSIASVGVQKLIEASGGNAKSMMAILSPCIRSCCYEVDIVKEIQRQLSDEGVSDIWTHPDCTGCHLDRYYSYRKELGKTGRMLAFMMIKA